MKTVTFAKTWRHPLSETSYEEYPAGATVEISNDRATAAGRAGVLKGADATDGEEQQTPADA